MVNTKNRITRKPVLFITVLGISLFLSCQSSNEQGYGKLEMLAKLPAKLNENSGIELMENGGIWLIEDNGNRDHLYGLNLRGEIIRELKIRNGKNEDWEDLAQDEEGNIYIGDFGNNNNDRRDLVIYRIGAPDKATGPSIRAETIRFSYPQQKEFPPAKEYRRFDSEALFFWDNQLYIVTKNRTRPFDGKAYFYRVPAIPGEYQAELVDSLFPCPDPANCLITAADISPDGKTLALMSYGKLFLLTDFDLDAPSKGHLETIDLQWPTQMESVCFENNTSLLIGDEQSETKGRLLYRMNLNGLH